MLQLFYMDISCDCSYEQSQTFYKVLPPERQEKINKVMKQELAKKRLLAGIFMQYGLSIVTGISMKNIRYVYGEQGKPYLYNHSFGKAGKLCGESPESAWPQDEKKDCRNLDFSLSHSGKYAVLAVSDRCVGIDVEQQRKNGLSVAKRCFHENEYADIMSLADEMSRNQRFLEYWTMKEAYVKRTGEGLGIPLRSFEVKRVGEQMSYVEFVKERGGTEKRRLKSRMQCGRVWFVTGAMEQGKYAVSVCSENVEELKTLLEFTDLSGKKKSPVLRMTKVTKEQIMAEI